MKVLLVGYLAKPLVVPLAEMIRASASDVAFEAAGNWVSESESIPTEIPLHDIPGFLFARCSVTNSPGRGKTKAAGNRASAAALGPTNALGGFAKATLKDLALEVAYRMDSAYFQRQHRNLISQFDVVHLHSLFSNMIHHRIRNQELAKPVVVTLWGSDVMRSHDARALARSQQLLNRATLITCSTPQFREIALSKYGRHLAPKFRETYFSANDAMMRQIVETDKAAARRQLAARHDIPDEAIVVCIGHNAAPDNQQVEALAGLARQDVAVKQRLFVLLPMTYCHTDPTHVSRVQTALSHSGIQGKVLTEFMQPDELVELRKGADVQIYVAVSDVFSATVSQALIAKQVVISGSWLPYQARRDAGFHFWEIERPERAGACLAALLSDWSATQAVVQQNEAVGRQFFDPLRLGRQWYDVYTEAIRMKAGTQA